MSDSHIGQRGYWTGKNRSNKTKEKISLSRKNKKLGEENPNWLGGKSKETYSKEFNRRNKMKIRLRDNYTCQLCFAKEDGRAFDVHHIDYDKNNINQDNLITLCRSCHSKTGARRTMWQEYFMTTARQEKNNV